MKLALHLCPMSEKRVNGCLHGIVSEQTRAFCSPRAQLEAEDLSWATTVFYLEGTIFPFWCYRNIMNITISDHKKLQGTTRVLGSCPCCVALMLLGRPWLCTTAFMRSLHDRVGAWDHLEKPPLNIHHRKVHPLKRGHCNAHSHYSD